MGELSHDDKMVFPGNCIPSFRTKMALQNKVEKNLLLYTFGGIGDIVCSEPTLRYAFSNFKDCNISIASEYPELFSHLPFKEVFNTKGATPKWDDYFVFHMIMPPPHLNWEFISHALINCVDYPALNAFRMQLPVCDREIYLSGTPYSILQYEIENPIYVHAGKHWQSKTFPKSWWDEVLSELINLGCTPVLIGADIDDDRRGTVDVNPSCCLDLRNKLTIQETTYLLQRAKVLLTNDSSPLHIAASCDPNDPVNTGHCYIGVLSTCKHPDFIMHFRKGVWKYREKNHTKGGLWEILNFCPNQDEEVMLHSVDQELLESWLPDPAYLAKWAFEKSR